MKRLTYILTLLLIAVMSEAQELSENSRISLLTCTPGEELYARYGHTAIRVVDATQGWDVVFNYGLFSFEDSGFYWHFVQGQTWYELGVESYEAFMYEYRYTHRAVAEQVLQLDYAQRQQLWTALLENAQPENRKYLYNFVFDNCATRPYHMLKHVLGDTIVSTYKGWEGASYRDFIHYYTRHGSWAEFGIDLIFGYKADRSVIGEGRLFLPEELMYYISQSYLPNGQRLVETERLTPFVIEPVPWWRTWYVGIAVFGLVMIWLGFYDRRRGKRTRWVDITLYVLYGLMAALLIFLIFFSIHPLVSLGWRVFLIPFIHLCTRYIYIWR